MQLIQKMTLTLLVVALLPVFLVSGIFYLNAQSSLKSRQLNQLDSIAAIQQSRIENLITQNNTLVANYTARVALRANLDRYNKQGRAADQDLIQQSVSTLQTGNANLRAVSILNATGHVVASTRATTIGRNDAGEDYFKDGQLRHDVTSSVARNEDGDVSLYLTGPFILDGHLIGVAVMESNLNGLSDLTADYTGLGKTGETILAKLDGQGDPTYILPLRFDKTAALQSVISLPSEQNPVPQALSKRDGTIASATGYRGQPVMAAVRYIPAAGWGLVVQIDQKEAYEPLTQLSDLLLVVMFILSVVIIFVAFYLARRLNEPILNLAIAADKVRAGDLAARASVISKDEIGQLAGTFNAMAENVEKVDQMKSEFVLLTSHQLRTPATAVKGFISMLLDNYAGKVSPKQTELLAAAYTENERQISVINSILDVARMEAGEMVLVRGTHDVAQILEASAKGQAPLLESHGQTISVLTPTKPVSLWVDATKLQLVVDNLIHNAIKYSPRDTKITVTLRQSRDHVVIEVRDQGMGIARRDLPRLFKRFSRIASRHTANIQGAGLGLYLAQKLVAMHDGKIEVHSREGVGTRFVITLPNITRKDPES